MKKALMLAFGLAMAAAPLPVGASKLTYDLRSDWSNSANPNGPWALRAGSAVLPFIPNWTWIDSVPQPAWATSNNLGSFLPAWFQAASTRDTSEFGWNQGDIIVHTTDVPNGQGAGDANVLFTSPRSGAANISGSLWSARISLGRPETWYLVVDGMTLASGTLTGTPATGQTHPETFNLKGLLLSYNSIVAIVFPKDSQHGDFEGVNLTVAFIPEPASLALLGSAMVALGLLRRHTRRGLPAPRA